MTDNTAHFLHKAGNYGFQEFLEIMGELSQESTKKGLLTRLQKELITLGLAMYKDCHRCIDIHSQSAKALHATEKNFNLVRTILLFVKATPHGDSELWDSWVKSWNSYSFSKNNEKRQLREMIALSIAIVKQHKKQIELHLKGALDIGVSIEEIFEIVPIVLLMDGAPTLSQIPRIVQGYERYTEEHK